MQRCIPDVRSVTTKETLKSPEFSYNVANFYGAKVHLNGCSMHFSTLNSKQSQCLEITKIVSFYF